MTKLLKTIILHQKLIFRLVLHLSFMITASHKVYVKHIHTMLEIPSFPNQNWLFQLSIFYTTSKRPSQKLLTENVSHNAEKVRCNFWSMIKTRECIRFSHGLFQSRELSMTSLTFNDLSFARIFKLQVDISSRVVILQYLCNFSCLNFCL